MGEVKAYEEKALVRGKERQMILGFVMVRL
jgi:hypothetical protein